IPFGGGAARRERRPIFRKANAPARARRGPARAALRYTTPVRRVEPVGRDRPPAASYNVVLEPASGSRPGFSINHTRAPVPTSPEKSPHILLEFCTPGTRPLDGLTDGRAPPVAGSGQPRAGTFTQGRHEPAGSESRGKVHGDAHLDRPHRPHQGRGPQALASHGNLELSDRCDRAQAYRVAELEAG